MPHKYYKDNREFIKALEASGDSFDAASFRSSLKKASFDSVRGSFKFGSNNHPIQDIYIREVVQEGDILSNKIVSKAFTDHQDAYAAECKM